MLKYGTLTVSSEWMSKFKMSKMFDDDPTTSWISKEEGGDWVRYTFNNQQVVSNVAIIRRGTEYCFL